MSLETFAQLSTAILAFVATAFAWLATRRVRESNRIALFDRKHAVFAAVREVLSEIMREAKADFRMVAQLARAYQDSRFLFPISVTNHIHAIHGRVVAYAVAEKQTHHLDGTAQQDAIDKEYTLLRELIGDLTNLHTVFKPHISLEEWSATEAVGQVKQQLAEMNEWLTDAIERNRAEKDV